MFYNQTVDKGKLKKLIAWAYQNYGSARCSQMADALAFVSLPKQGFPLVWMI